MTNYLLCKIKPGKRKLWQTWCTFVMEHHLEEAKQTLKEEGLIREGCWIYPDDSVLYEHETVGNKKKPWKKTHTLNWLHYYLFLECLEIVEKKSRVRSKRAAHIGYEIHANTY